MAINEVPVGLDQIYFISAAEDFQAQTDEDGTESYRTSFPDGEAYYLDVQISAFVSERGLEALTSQAVTVEVPIEKAAEELKRIRSIPKMSEVKFGALTMRHGVTKSNKAYAMWTGKGLHLAKAPAPAAAQRQG